MKKIFLLTGFAILIFSCEKNDVYLEGNIKTIEITDIKTTSAVVKGNLQIIADKSDDYWNKAYSSYENGICYSTSSNPTINDKKEIGKKITKIGSTAATVTNPKDGEFIANITELQKNTTYYVRAYTINELGIFYGNELFFNTLSFIFHTPEVSTLSATDVTENTATLHGRIDNEGEPTYTERGFIYSSTFKNPTIEDVGTTTKKHIVWGKSIDFHANVEKLVTGTIYYVRAYATDSSNNNTAYGDSVSFNTTHPDYYILASKNIMVQKQDRYSK
jgi:hypothetical protein